MRYLWIVLLLLNGTLFAQWPDAPQPQSTTKRIFSPVNIVNLSLITTSNIVDTETTQRIISQGGFETNPIFGRYPSRARMYGEGLALDYGRYALAAILAHGIRQAGHRKLARIPEFAMTGYLVEEHVHGAIGNFRALR